MATITPFVKRMRTQGGTIYTFSSALEDIGLNINERNNVVKMSHYALLNIPAIDAPAIADASTVNKFNVLAIPGAFKSWLDSGSIKDGRIIVAESFQNYALNLETNLLADPDYNPAISTTISERVLWKWLKETGAIRWVPTNTPAGTYWEEEIDTDSSTGYNSIVKCIGQISAGSVRTDTFGTYNETYVLVPTSFGQTPVYFKQVEDDNYYHGWYKLNGNVNILGRESYTKPHPDGLDIKAYYDMMDSSLAVNSYLMYNSSDNVTWNPGWWWTNEGFPLSVENCYFIDSDSYLDTSIFSTNLLYDDGATQIQFKRSNVDCMSIEFDLDKLKTIMSDSTLTFDKLAIDYAEDDTFDFNAILIYYSVYNKTLDKVLATNLLGILFLDPASGNTQYYGSNPIEITMPSITKLQSGVTGFGTSYAFRLNIKSDYMIDDTQAIVTDTTAADAVVESCSDILDNLAKSLAILNQQSATISFISEQYLDISAQQTNILNELNDLQYQVNDIARDITGTENAIAMFADGDDPLVDSSIYMKYGKIGFFNDKPSWPVQIDASLKTKDIYVENAVRDVSGNILIGYGSPIQIGSTTINRAMNFNTGSLGPAISIDSSNNMVFDGLTSFTKEVNFSVAPGGNWFLREASMGPSFKWNNGIVDVSGGSGSMDYPDAGIPISTGSAWNLSIPNNSGNWNAAYGWGNHALAGYATTAQIEYEKYIREVSLGSGLAWVGGLLNVTEGGVSQLYVDGSLAKKLDIAGGTMTGDLNVQGNLTVENDIEAQTDVHVQGNMGIGTAPTSDRLKVNGTLNAGNTTVADLVAVNTTLNNLTANGAITCNGSTVNINNGQHKIVTSTSNITQSGSIALMPSMTTSLTPKGKQMLITFSAPIYTSSNGARAIIYIYVNSIQKRKMSWQVYSHCTPCSFQHIESVTPGTSYTVEVKWGGSGASTAIQQRGTIDSERILTVVDLY